MGEWDYSLYKRDILAMLGGAPCYASAVVYQLATYGKVTSQAPASFSTSIQFPTKNHPLPPIHV